MTAGILGPFLYHDLWTPAILFSLGAILEYSIKTGLMSFFVIPSVLSGIVCTAYGYLNVNKFFMVLVLFVVSLGPVAIAGLPVLVDKFMNEPVIRWEKIAADEVTSAGLWVYDGVSTGHFELSKEETEHIRSLFNFVPKDRVTEVKFINSDPSIDIVFGLKSNDTIRIQYDQKEIRVAITKKRSIKYFVIESPEFNEYFAKKRHASSS
ncbi:hypothetical protein AB6A23_23150 [Paenibacillus tarimensis]